MGVARKFKNILVAIIVIVAWYTVLFTFILSVKDSVVDYLHSHNYTLITLNELQYNTTSGEWERAPRVIDLTGFIDLTLTILVVFGPLLYAIYKIAR